jgi:vacuolar-type H+-ATPase subunit I/STV1
VYLDEGVWVLPNTEVLARAVRDLTIDVERQGGTAAAFVARGLNPQQEEKLLTRFNQAKEEEYAEVLRECQKLLAHIQRETAAQHYEFAEVEELEEDLEKNQRWLTQVRERDSFGIEAGYIVQQHLQSCRAALDQFTQAVYELRSEDLALD